MSGCFGLGCLLLPVCCRAASRRESGPNNIAEDQVASHLHEYLYTGGNARVKSVTNRLRFTFHPSRFTFPGRSRRVWCLLAGAVGDRESSRRGLRSRPIGGNRLLCHPIAWGVDPGRIHCRGPPSRVRTPADASEFAYPVRRIRPGRADRHRPHASALFRAGDRVVEASTGHIGRQTGRRCDLLRAGNRSPGTTSPPRSAPAVVHQPPGMF